VDGVQEFMHVAGRVRDEDAYSTVDETGQHACLRTQGKHGDILSSHKDGVQPRKTNRNRMP